MFRPMLGAGVLVFAVLASGQLPAQEKASPAKKKGGPAKEKLYRVGVYAGKVLEVEEDGDALRVRVYGRTAVPRFTPGIPSS